MKNHWSTICLFSDIYQPPQFGSRTTKDVGATNVYPEHSVYCLSNASSYVQDFSIAKREFPYRVSHSRGDSSTFIIFVYSVFMKIICSGPYRAHTIIDMNHPSRISHYFAIKFRTLDTDCSECDLELLLFL